MMLSAMRTFRQQLDSGKVCIGCGISTTDPSVTESVAELFDFLWVDLEHTALTFESLQAHLIAARATASPALVRGAERRRRVGQEVPGYRSGRRHPATAVYGR